VYSDWFSTDIPVKGTRVAMSAGSLRENSHFSYFVLKIPTDLRAVNTISFCIPPSVRVQVCEKPDKSYVNALSISYTYISYTYRASNLTCREIKCHVDGLWYNKKVSHEWASQAKKTTSVIFPLKKHTSAVFCLSHDTKSEHFEAFLARIVANLIKKFRTQGSAVRSQMTRRRSI
jgi:hypothetical protein